MTQSAETTARLTAILREMESENQRHSAQMTAHIQHFQEVWLGMGDPVVPPERVLFASPCTGKVGDVFGGDWFIATGYAEYYTANGVGAYHTGVDLNRPGYKDSGAAVYAAANGTVVVSDKVAGWQGLMIVIEHVLEDGSKVWTRYAHLNIIIGLGPVKRGDVIGYIGDYTPTNDPRGDHLHYDVSHKDLGKYPDDWPGNALGRVYADYVDPVKWHKVRAV